VVAHNRDEFTSRPFTRFSSHGDLWYGEDSESKGTWLAVDTKGRYSVVLNIRDNPNVNAAPQSRGELPIKCLREPNFFDCVSRSAACYKPFTVIRGVVGSGSVVYSSSNNRFENIERSKPFAISNNPAGVAWAKPDRALDGLTSMQHRSHEALAKAFFTVLESEVALPDTRLPATGFPIETERELSCNFVRLKGYQTVISTLVLFMETGEVSVIEKNHLMRTQLFINNLDAISNI